MPDLSLMGNQRAACQFIIQVEMRSPVLEKVSQVTCNGPGIHLAPLKRHRAWQVQRTDNDYAVLHDFLPGLGEGAVSALLGSKVHDD